MNHIDVKRIYLDNSLLIGWFLPYMKGEKTPPEPEIVKFLHLHPEIEVFISSMSVAELMESLLYKEAGVKDYLRKKEYVIGLLDALRELLNIKIIIHKGKNSLEGNFVTNDIIEFTALCKQPKDAIHAAIAKYEDLCLVTHDRKSTILSQVYNKTITDTHLYKFFDK